MPKPIHAVLFDLDGTLVNTSPDFIRIIKKMCKAENLPCPSDDEICEQVSAGSRAMVRLIKPDANLDDPSVEQYREVFLAEYAKIICIDSCLYEGFDEVLDWLENTGLPWGIVTNKPRHLAELVVAELGLTERCKTLVCPEDVSNAKPNPEPMYLAASQLGVENDKIMYVGDHPRDIEAGAAACMPTVIATYGYLPPNDAHHEKHKDNLLAWGADYMIDKPIDMIGLLSNTDELVLQAKPNTTQENAKQTMENTDTTNTQVPANEVLNEAQMRAFVPKSECLQNKVILVTGAGDGIGKQAALTYAKLGATVLLLGRTTSKLEAVYDEIEDKYGLESAIIPLNLEGATQADIQNLAPLIESEFGRLDGILHNAAILGPLTPLAMYPQETFDTVMKVNFHSVFTLTQVLLPLLEKSKNGSCVFITSSVGSQPRAFWGAYALSKQGVEGMCDIFTQETKNISNLRFNCINPGGTRTNMRAKAYPGEDPNSLKTPEEIMGVFIYLMSDESIAVRGQVIKAQ